MATSNYKEANNKIRKSSGPNISLSIRADRHPDRRMLELDMESVTQGWENLDSRSVADGERVWMEFVQYKVGFDFSYSKTLTTYGKFVNVNVVYVVEEKTFTAPSYLPSERRESKVGASDDQTGNGNTFPISVDCNDSNDLQMLIRNRKLHIHFIDIDSIGLKTSSSICERLFESLWRKITCQPTKSVNKSLFKDIKTLYDTAPGVLLTWNGQITWPGDRVHKVLQQLYLEEKKDNRNFAAAACICRNNVPENPQNSLQKGDRRPSMQPGHLQSGVYGATISPFSTHCVLTNSDSNHLGNTTAYYEAFSSLIKAASSDEGNKDVQQVCILISGGERYLDVVKLALDNRIPVIVMDDRESSKNGDYAGRIADLYRNAYNQKKRGECSSKNRSRLTPLRLPPSNLEDVANNLDYISLYNPQRDDLLHCIVGTFRKCRLLKVQEDILNISSVPKLSRLQSTEINDPSAVKQEMDMFLAMLLEDKTDFVADFFNGLQKESIFWDKFDAGSLRVLYIQKKISDIPELVYPRKYLFSYLRNDLTFLQMVCIGDRCPKCDLRETVTDFQRGPNEDRMPTCLHPIQELFLWSVIAGRKDMALLFWEKCDDKIASALFARGLLNRIASKCNDPKVKANRIAFAERFQKLAIATLNSCHEWDWHLSKALLTKPCPWWGNMSILLLAIETQNGEFIAQEACKTKLDDDIWRGKELNDVWNVPLTEDASRNDWSTRWAGLVDLARKPTLCCCPNIVTPKSRYILSCILYPIFLALYTYVMLYETGRRVTPAFGVFIVWMITFTLEEARQAGMAIFGKSKVGLWQILYNSFGYVSKVWNITDLAIISMFWLGFTFNGISETLGDGYNRLLGRILESLALCCLYLRQLQLLMVFERVGLILVMMGKMVKHVLYFTLILVVILMAYSLTSEAILYPEKELDLSRLVLIHRNAFWHVFGEFRNLDSIENGENNCTVVTNFHFAGLDNVLCPAELNRYVALFLLGLYIVTTNVLLLNLLIAYFSDTFSEVRSKAINSRFWLYMEYHSVVSLPPPFCIIDVINALVTWSVKKSTPPEVSIVRSVDGTQMCVSWTKACMSSTDRPTSVLIELMSCIGNNENVKRKYEIPVENWESTQQTMIWNLDPFDKYTVRIKTHNFTPSINTNYLKWFHKLRDFEDTEAMVILEQYKEFGDLPMEHRELYNAMKNVITSVKSQSSRP